MKATAQQSVFSGLVECRPSLTGTLTHFATRQQPIPKLSHGQTYITALITTFPSFLVVERAEEVESDLNLILWLSLSFSLPPSLIYFFLCQRPDPLLSHALCPSTE